MQVRFVKINNKAVRLDAISYIEFLESGRAMVILSGLPPEKAHISVDAAETRGLREFFDKPELTANPSRDSRSAYDMPVPRQYTA
ncbi:MAG TPA: hypothetical protein VGL72_28520 [Bryobacteraceae bacterium]|jgi:hypothetical protein